jgi:signal transduction histidine kinase
VYEPVRTPRNKRPLTPAQQARVALRRAVVLPVFLLAGFSALMLWHVVRLLDLTGWVDLTDRMISEAVMVQALAVDMETGLRGLLVTGDETFLEPYVAASARVRAQIAEVQALIEQSPLQPTHLDGLDAEVVAWMQYAEQMRERVSRGQDVSARELHLQGKQQMDQIRARIGSFIAFEEELRNSRVASVRATTLRTVMVAVIGALLVGLTLALVARTYIERVVRSYNSALQSRDQFLEVASHELKTPLTPLRLRIQKLQTEVARAQQQGEGLDPEVLTADLRQLDHHVGRTAGLVQQILLASEAALPPIRLESVDLTELVGEVVGAHRAQFQRSGTALLLETHPHVQGTWDRFRVEQIVGQLLSNALKFGNGRPVTVRVEQEGAEARLSVEDQGQGIATEDQARIFGRFERAVSERHYGGFGLGLWAIRTFAGQLGGQVSVWSQPGSGARFEVRLPLRPARR